MSGPDPDDCSDEISDHDIVAMYDPDNEDRMFDGGDDDEGESDASE